MLPIMAHFNWDPVWFGVMMTVNLALAPGYTASCGKPLCGREYQRPHNGTNQQIGIAANFAALLALLVIIFIPGLSTFMPKMLNLYQDGVWQEWAIYCRKNIMQKYFVLVGLFNPVSQQQCWRNIMKIEKYVPNRRNFLKTSALTLAGAAILPFCSGIPAIGAEAARDGTACQKETARGVLFRKRQYQKVADMIHNKVGGI